jgi:hypothetical protein
MGESVRRLAEINGRAATEPHREAKLCGRRRAPGDFRVPGLPG